MSGRGGFRENAGRKPNPEGQKPKISVTLSKEAIASLDATATALRISRSELVERYARSLLNQPEATAATNQCPICGEPAKKILLD